MHIVVAGADVGPVVQSPPTALMDVFVGLPPVAEKLGLAVRVPVFQDLRGGCSPAPLGVCTSWASSSLRLPPDGWEEEASENVSSKILRVSCMAARPAAALLLGMERCQYVPADPRSALSPPTDPPSAAIESRPCGCSLSKSCLFDPYIASMSDFGETLP